MATILLTGANGKISSETITRLKGSGHKLVALVRNPDKAAKLAADGVEVRTGDLDKPRTIEGAFAGVDTAWLLAPPGPLAPYQTSNALWAAKQAGVKHVVRMSAVGAAHDAPTVNSRMHALSDAEVAASGLPYTIVRPHFFMQNFLGMAQGIAAQGAIYFALGDAAMPMVDTRDIAAVVAKILASPAEHAKKTYTPTGPTAVTMHQVAAAIAEATGKKVTYFPVPVAAAVESMTKWGLDDYGQVAMRDYLTAYSQGWQSQTTPDVERITGDEPRAIAQFARDFATAFGG